MAHVSFTNDEVKALIEAFDNHYLNGIAVLYPNEQSDKNVRENIRSEFAKTGNVLEPTEYQRTVMIDASFGYLMRFLNPDVTYTNTQLRTRDALRSLITKLESVAGV